MTTRRPRYHPRVLRPAARRPAARRPAPRPTTPRPPYKTASQRLNRNQEALGVKDLPEGASITFEGRTYVRRGPRWLVVPKPRPRRTPTVRPVASAPPPAAQDTTVRPRARGRRSPSQTYTIATPRGYFESTYVETDDEAETQEWIEAMNETYGPANWGFRAVEDRP